MSENSVTTPLELYNGLQSLGIVKGTQLIVHSSLKSFGSLEGGANTFIHTLQTLVTLEGIIMMPTFTYGYDPYNKSSTPSKTGHITEVFRKQPNVYRSEHPTHSVAIWGNQAKEWCQGHLTESPFAEGTPLRRLLPKGYVLLAGVDYIACSMIHVGQQLANSDYLSRPKKMVEIVNTDGSKYSMSAQRAGCSRGFFKLGPYIQNAQQHKAGNSILTLVTAEELVEITVHMLHQDREALYCNNPACLSCNGIREALKING